MDEMNVKALLKEEIANGIQSLKSIDHDAEGYKTAVDALSKLVDKYNDMVKLENQCYVDEQNLDIKRFDNEYKLDQLNQERKDHIIKNLLTTVSVLGGFALTVWGTNKTLKFEETGTITTTAGRNLISRLFPKK